MTVRVRGICLALVAGVALSAPLSAQQGTITGRITDSATKRSLPGSSVQIVQTGKVVAVRADGRYVIAGLSAGRAEENEDDPGRNQLHLSPLRNS